MSCHPTFGHHDERMLASEFRFELSHESSIVRLPNLGCPNRRHHRASVDSWEVSSHSSKQFFTVFSRRPWGDSVSLIFPCSEILTSKAAFAGNLRSALRHVYPEIELSR